MQFTFYRSERPAPESTRRARRRPRQLPAGATPGFARVLRLLLHIQAIFDNLSK